MPSLALLSAVFVIGFEQIVQSTYGMAGILGLLLLTIGIKAESPAIGSAGAVVLAVLFAGVCL